LADIGTNAVTGGTLSVPTFANLATHGSHPAGAYEAMPSSPSSSAQAARQRLGEQLRQMRRAARISGVRFAELAGWKDATNVSKIERAQRTITADHVRLWCRVTGASERRTEELLAEQANVARMWVTYQQLNRGGLSAAQKSVRKRYERLRLMRTYQPRGFPGLLQTEAYTRGVLEGVWDEQGVESDDRETDLAAAVAERIDRQSVLRRPGKRFVHVMEESAAKFRVLPRDVHREQILHTLEVMHLPSVTLGIIPMNAGRDGMRPREGFIITDDKTVNVELVSGYLTVTHPTEVAMYQHVFDRLLALAVHGDQCEEILRRALADLDD
jgi:transcriptional regulator with XRE-family HTH domain